MLPPFRNLPSAACDHLSDSPDPDARTHTLTHMCACCFAHKQLPSQLARCFHPVSTRGLPAQGCGALRWMCGHHGGCRGFTSTNSAETDTSRAHIHMALCELASGWSWGVSVVKVATLCLLWDVAKTPSKVDSSRVQPPGIAISWSLKPLSTLVLSTL